MLRFDYRADAPGAPFDLALAVYHDVIVCADRFKLLPRALKAAEDDLLGLGTASSQPPLERGAVRRDQHDRNAVGKRALDLRRALDLDLEYDVAPLAEKPFDLRTERAVVVPEIFGIFEHLARRDLSFEIRAGGEVVVHAADLAGARCARCRRYRSPHVGHDLPQLGHDRSLAGACRSRYYKQYSLLFHIIMSFFRNRMRSERVRRVFRIRKARGDRLGLHRRKNYMI